MTIDERVECAIAFGRSDEWILTHLPCTRRDITRAENRIDAAHRDDNAAWLGAHKKSDGELDETLVQTIIDGANPIHAHSGTRYPPEFAEAIRRLAGQGLNDPEIAAKIRRTRDAVTAARKRYGIAAGNPQTGSLAWREIRRRIA